jgi:glycosyltransferase involved in cell wall biosynthesis
MQNPKVSIIIPTYNRSKFLPCAIESALAQDYLNLEVIVSDNASTDDTQEVIKKYLNKPNFKYFRNSKNLGFAYNLRKAVYDYSNGDWVLMLSDDDYLLDSSYTSKAMKSIRNDGNIILVFANYKIYYVDRNIFEDTNIILPNIIDGKWAFWNFWTEKFPGIGNLTTLFNRKKAIQVDAFGRDIIGPDTELWLKLLLLGKISFIKDLVAVYRLHGNNQILQVDLEKNFKNFDGIKEAANFAISLGFDKYKIKNWTREKIKISLTRILNLILEEGGFNDLKQFFLKIHNEKLDYYLISFFNIKVFIRMILFLINPKLPKIMRHIYKTYFRKKRYKNHYK